MSETRKNTFDFSTLASMPDGTDIFPEFDGTDEITTPEDLNEELTESAKIPWHALKKGANGSKKLLDAADDVWTAASKKLPNANLITPKITGSISLFLGLYEGVIGASRAYRAFKDKNTPLRETKIVTGLLTAFFAALMVGVGLAFAILGTIIFLKAATAILAFFPTAILSLSLLRKMDKLFDAHTNYEIAEQRYFAIEAEYKQVHATNSSTLSINKRLSPSKVQPNLELEKELEKKYIAAGELRDKCYKNKLETERGYAFTSIELIASAFVLTGTILGIVGLFGAAGAAAAASFGVIPFALVVTGITLAVVSKIFEWVDEKYDHKITNGMRRFFKNTRDSIKDTWNSLFSKSNCHSSILKIPLAKTSVVREAVEKPVAPKSACTAIPIPSPLAKIKEKLVTVRNNSLPSIFSNPKTTRVAQQEKTAYTQTSHTPLKCN